MSQEEDVDLGGIFGFMSEPEEEAKPAQAAQKKHVTVLKSREEHQYRRISSEAALNEALPWHFEKGVTYHAVSFGDVDSLTYLRVIVKQQRLRYAIVSTWCARMEHVEEVKKWLDAGYIERIDWYVGEVFGGRYLPIYEYIRQNCLRNGARIAVFRNHAKVLACFGESFDCVVTSSANFNINPRTENTTITVNGEVARWYKNFFDDINAFNSDDCKGWTPFDLDTSPNAPESHGEARTCEDG